VSIIWINKQIQNVHILALFLTKFKHFVKESMKSYILIAEIGISHLGLCTQLNPFIVSCHFFAMIYGNQV